MKNKDYQIQDEVYDLIHNISKERDLLRRQIAKMRIT